MDRNSFALSAEARRWALGWDYPLVLSDYGSVVRDYTAIQIRSEDGGENQQNIKQSSF